eukprot:6206037-Pleurochrysis_carterae.AAC.1
MGPPALPPRPPALGAADHAQGARTGRRTQPHGRARARVARIRAPRACPGRIGRLLRSRARCTYTRMLVRALG